MYKVYIYIFILLCKLALEDKLNDLIFSKNKMFIGLHLCRNKAVVHINNGRDLKGCAIKGKIASEVLQMAI